MKKLFTLVLIVSMVIGASASFAAGNWPSKTINVFVTHSAGGDTDYLARQLFKSVETILGQTVVVSNVTGANGATCMQQYRNGNADGYTFIATNSAALLGNYATGMVDFSYDAFEPVAVYSRSAENIVVPADAPYSTLDELIAATQKNPGKIRLGISTGGGVYIMACVLTNIGKAQFNVIDVGDGAQRLAVMLGGEVDVTSLPYETAADYIESGKIKSLCTLLSEAPAYLPDQKPACAIIPELVMETECVILAPKGTPAHLTKAMNEAILKATDTPEWKKMFKEHCFQEPFVLNLKETNAELKKQYDLFNTFMPYL